MAGEVLNVARPVVYSGVRLRRGDESRLAWLASLTVDVMAYACTARAYPDGYSLFAAGERRQPVQRRQWPGPATDSAAAAATVLSPAEAAELRRRKALWMLYLLRSPVFEVLASPAARATAAVFEGVPLLGGLANYALEMLLYVQRHHFYVAGS
ncbi:unnamed protein product [Phaeothamnion confervicola]